MDEQKYNQYLKILEIDDNATLAEIKTAYERLKKIYSAQSIVLEAIDDELSENDKHEILENIQEAYTGLFHYLVEKDRQEKEKQEKEEQEKEKQEKDKTAKEIFDISEIENIAEEIQDTDSPLLFEEESHEASPEAPKEENSDEPFPEITMLPELAETPELSAIANLPEIIPEPPPPPVSTVTDEIPGPLELPALPDLGVPEDTDEILAAAEPLLLPETPPAPPSLPDSMPEPLTDSFAPPEPNNMADTAIKVDFQDTQEMYVAVAPLELPEYIFPEPPPPENSTMEMVETAEKESPYATILKVSDPSATNPIDEPVTESPAENFETEGPSAVIKGRTFKKYRERMGLGIHELAKSTNISYKILVNIELERFENLPEPGYLRWCVASYAKALGMASPSIADEYMKRFRKWKQQQIEL